MLLISIHFLQFGFAWSVLQKMPGVLLAGAPGRGPRQNARWHFLQSRASGLSAFRSNRAASYFIKEIKSTRHKNIELLLALEEFVHYVGGARVTCCKSGKVNTIDVILASLTRSIVLRTGRPCPSRSSSVRSYCAIITCTLAPSSRSCFQCNKMPFDAYQTLDLMRSIGTRRENVQKNIGERRSVLIRA